MNKICPSCGDELKAEAFNEVTIYQGDCGYFEAWHRGASEDNPQTKPCLRKNK